MASGSNAKTLPSNEQALADLLVCPICLENFKDPKTLSCLHSFCLSCLENCRRPYRRDVSCPVCKKATPLPTCGVAGLQSDFRIQQIKDLLTQQQQQQQMDSSPSPPRIESPVSSNHEERPCDVCRTQNKAAVAGHHCVQCCMYFCSTCFERHKNNKIFVNHHVIEMGAISDGMTDIYCKIHREYTVRYFCRPCAKMLCTVCTLDHEPEHKPVPLDNEIITQYQTELHDTLKTIGSKLVEVKKRAKYLETLKQSHQKALYEAQRAIRAKTDEVISSIKEQERKLLYDVQQKMETRLKQVGFDTLGEMNFHRSNIELLHQDVQTLINTSPQQCLLSYEELISRMKAVTDTVLPSVSSDKNINSIVKFVPVEPEQNDALLGQLQECSISNDEIASSNDEVPSSPERPSTSYAQLLASASPQSPKTARTKRVTSILNALSSSTTRKSDVKIGRVKTMKSPDRCKSPNAINADDLIGSTSTASPDLIVIDDNAAAAAVTSSSPPTVSPQQREFLTPRRKRLSTTAARPFSPGLPLSPSDVIPAWSEPRLVYKKDEIGGWPGKLMEPSSVCFLDELKVAVVEKDTRVQLFDCNGSSIQLLGWGRDNFKPVGVCPGPNGTLVVTDRGKPSVALFKQNGEIVRSFDIGAKLVPAGCARQESNDDIVLIDQEKHKVYVFSSSGMRLHSFGEWGSEDYLLNSPFYVATNCYGNIFISDTRNNAIKDGIYFPCKIPLRSPHGLACDKKRNIFVCDKENHRIHMFNADGVFQKYVLTKADGLKHPVDLAVADSGHIAVVEQQVGLMSEHHCALKLFVFK